jgi:hypothetical protein
MDFNTPVGRLVQGSVKLEHQTDMRTKQKKFDADGSAEMAVFFAVAFPKVLPNGQQNTEFGALWAQMVAAAAEAWPQFVKPDGTCTNPKFSWKFQDGDGVDDSGQSVANKPGFAGHYIIKFQTSYPVRCFYEGKFAAHEEIQNPEQVIKRGYWVRVFGEMKSNMADLTKQQVPGIAIYPKLISFVERGDEIVSGPDAQAAFGAAAIGWRPPASANPVGMPTPGQPVMPGQPAMQMPPAGNPTQPVTPGAAVRMPAMPGAGLPAMPGAGLPAMPGAGAPTMPMLPGAPMQQMQPPAPQYALRADLVQQGMTYEALNKTQGWTWETLVAQGYATRIA